MPTAKHSFLVSRRLTRPLYRYTIVYRGEGTTSELLISGTSNSAVVDHRGSVYDHVLRRTVEIHLLVELRTAIQIA